MTNRQPSFGRYFTLAYEDAVRVISRMWPAVLVVVAIIVVTGFLSRLAAGLIGTGLGKGVLDLLFGAAAAYLIAPYLMALYRSVATDEAMRNPEALRSTSAAQRFAAWSVLTAFILAAPGILYGTFGPNVPPDQLTEDDINAGAMLLVMGLAIAVWIFSVRATTLMPLLALDPERASLPAAFAQTRGHFWFIVGVLLITMLPLVVGETIITGLVVGIAGPLAAILLVPIGAAMSGVMLVTAIAVSTRLYQRFAGA